MTPKNSPTAREVDLTLARALRRARALARAVENGQVAARPAHRTRTPGPNSYKRMTAGQLVTAALGGAVLYAWSKQEEQTFERELANRGFEESLARWREDATVTDDDAGSLATDRFDQAFDRLSVVTVGSLETLAVALDEVLLGNDGRVDGALPASEVIEDMQITGAHPDAVAAYEQGVGVSPVSPTDALTEQGPLEPTPASELGYSSEATDDLAL
ncbi:hypothetical protein [Corynebacterium senegalense]|uniref:hypothetical protein n=1 Tax=Corynebacterium senegalense TaxID=2080750 RepID=UPI0011C01DA6|nr:hypothetical protein [Corynebacterium senegalense]